MSRKKIRIITVLATLSLVGLLAVQLTWLNKAYSLEEKEFNFSVQVALSSVSQQLLKEAGLSQTERPVKQVSSSFYLAQVNGPIQAQELDTLLKKEFAQRDLSLAYEYGILNAYDDTLVFGNYIPASQQRVITKSENEPAVNAESNPTKLYNFAVIFPTKTTHLLKEMTFWWFSTAALLIVIIFFAYTLISILKEKKLSELKADFINNMTHELQTPITNISIASELLTNQEMALTPQKTARYHQIIFQENERLKAQVERVLQMAALEKQELALTKSKTNVHQVLEETMQGLQLRMQKRSGKITVDLQAVQTNILADPLHVTNVVYNLLDNAEKYSPEAPEIEVATRNYKNGILISIADKGIGIKKEVQKFVFDKFYRVPTGNVHNVKGFGVGLSYVKTIIDAHNGTITLNSRQGQGSTFELFFPFG